MSFERNFDRDQFRSLLKGDEADFDPETGVKYDQSMPQYKKAIEIKEQTRIQNEVGDKNQLEQQVEGVINSINELKLLSEVENDENQNKLLLTKQKIAKDLIKETLDSVEPYVQSIINMNLIRMKKDDLDDYKNDLKNADQDRRIKHNTLIDNLKILKRFLNNNFGKPDQQKLEKFQQEEIMAGRPILKVQRIDLPVNTICPDKLNLSDRDQVGDWARQIFDVLGKIKKELA